ncbi:hypothetical protein F4604DRAFT_1492440, partial [Suillus subluteus]
VATLNPMTIEVLQIFQGSTTIVRYVSRPLFTLIILNNMGCRGKKLCDTITWNNLHMKLGDVVNICRCLDIPYGKGIYVLPFDDFIKGLSGNIFNVYPRPYFLE